MSDVHRCRVGEKFVIFFPAMSVTSQFSRHAVFVGPVGGVFSGDTVQIETDWDTDGGRTGNGLGLSGIVPADAPIGRYHLLRFEQKRNSDGALQITAADRLINAPELEVLEAKGADEWPEVQF